MFEKDFLKKQIDNFIRELVAILSKTNSKEKELILDKLSIKYTNKNISYFIELDAHEIIKQYNDADILEIIAELLLNYKHEHLIKVKEILEHINKISDEYSIIRQNKLLEINKILTKKI